MPAAGNPGMIPPLEPITLSTVALTTHSIAWSPDAELAIGCEDSVYIYLPEFTTPNTGTDNGARPPNYEPTPQYNEITLRFPTVELRKPELNRPLFEAVGQEFPRTSSDEQHSHPNLGSASATITGMGGSLNHVAALEWSPGGLGRMRRPALAVLTSGGFVTIYCEGASDGMGSFKVRGRNTRTLRSWVVPWAVGGELRIPAAASAADPVDRIDHVTAFAWANDATDTVVVRGGGGGGGGALFAYANDAHEVVILSVQARHKADAEPGDAGEWRVEEVDRFAAQGPHSVQDPTDPDYSPSGSSFSLSWSPWLNKSGSKSAFVSYVAKNYVGFRQVTLKTPWVHMETPEIEVTPYDSDGICLFLGSDAFVKWEDLVWTIDNEKVCRGLIATPARVQAFQLPFDAHTPTFRSRKHEHSIYDCNTVYPNPDETNQISNPITGLVVHPPSLSQTTSTPAFTLVRLSATSDNDNWYQTNLPLPPNPETRQEREPRWATEIEQSIQHQLPRSMAYQMVYNPENAEYEDEENDDGSDYGSDGDLGGDSRGNDGDGNGDGDGDGDIAGMRGLDTSDQVYTTRIRIWGLASSPGKGVTAVFVSPHSTLKPDRITFGGMKFKVLFGRHHRGRTDNHDDDDAPIPTLKNLSTEARVWEWMYGGGPPVPGIVKSSSGGGSGGGDNTPLKRKLAKVASSRLCPFCETEIISDDVGGKKKALASTSASKSSACANGHVFENCAATGIPIVAPGVSNTCAVCGSKCLKPGELLAIAGSLGIGNIQNIVEEISHELCGGCGGKFID